MAWTLVPKCLQTTTTTQDINVIKVKSANLQYSTLIVLKQTDGKQRVSQKKEQIKRQGYDVAYRYGSRCSVINYKLQRNESSEVMW
jgi:hypothetical protein